MRRALGLAVLGLGSMLVGCTEPDDRPVGSVDGGVDADRPADSGGPGDTAATACTATAAPVEVVRGMDLRALNLAGDELVFIEQQGTGLAAPTAIRRVRKDGSGAALVHAAPAMGRVSDVVVAGADAYFLQSTSAGGNLLVHRVPLAGGAAVRVSAPTSVGFDPILTNLFAADATSLYLTTMISGNGRLYRMTIADGTLTVIAEHAGALAYPQVVGDDVWFGPRQNLDGFYKAPKSATAPSGARVGTGTCGGPQLGLLVGTGGIFCGGAFTITRHDLQGENRTKILDILEEDAQSNVIAPAATDGAFVYAVGLTSPRVGRPLRKVAVSGGPVTHVACDRRLIEQLLVGPTELFWLETRNDGAGEAQLVFRVAR